LVLILRVTAVIAVVGLLMNGSGNQSEPINILCGQNIPLKQSERYTEWREAVSDGTFQGVKIFLTLSGFEGS
jgi:hypothetical protein